MPFRLLAACLLLLALLARPERSAAQAADTLRLGLTSAIQQALAVSPEVGEKEAQQAFAEARYRFAKANRFFTDFEATSAHAVAPGLDIPASNTFPDDALYLNPDVRNDWDDLRPFNRVEVELVQPIWTWGELGQSIRAARHGVAVEAADARAKASEVTLRTAELYYSLLLADALAGITDEAGRIVERAKSTVQDLIDEGEEGVDYADLYQVQITEQEYNRRVVEVAERQRTAEVALTRQLFLPPGTVIVPEDEVLAPLPFALDSLETYFALASESRPELAQAQAGIQARAALVRVARSDYFPKLVLGASANASYAEGRFRQRNPFISEPFLGRGIRAGLGIRQQLNFFQTKAEVEQAQAQENEVRYQLQAAEQLVLFEVEEAYRNVVIAQAALDAQDASLRISREWLRDEQINFDLDLGDTENLVDAVRTNLTLQASYYEAVQRYNVAALRLLDAAGVLLPRAETGTLVD